MSVEDSEALRDRLRALTDKALLASANAGTPPTGMGATSTFSLGFDEVFVKRLPLTDIEAANPYSTCNPLNCRPSTPTASDGVSAPGGSGSLRAVSGVSGFPVQLHNRVMSRSFPPQPLPWSDGDYVHISGGRAVGHYISPQLGRAGAVDRAGEFRVSGRSLVGREPRERARFPRPSLRHNPELQSREMVHFDAHWANIITDGARYRLVDFGLGHVNKTWELSEPERKHSLSNHLHYDYGVAIGLPN